MANVHLARATLHKFETLVRADQGSAYRGKLKEVIGHIGDAYRTDEDAHRSHMGASQIGAECPRAIWYNFRWATRSNFSGSMIRLFNRGHLEEARFIALLLSIGCEIYQQDAEGKQYRIKHADGHFGGSGDGVVIGCPDLQAGQPALGEFKTHNDKSFKELAGENWRYYIEHLVNPDKPVQTFTGGGVRESKFEHFVQCQVYMRKMGLAVCLYLAVNKNTDDIYAELIPLDSGIADQFLARGEKLVWMEEPPIKLNPSPGFYKCRFCDHKPVCHLKAVPERNCRTCQFSGPSSNGEWTCSKLQKSIDKETQLKGCDQYYVKACF